MEAAGFEMMNILTQYKLWHQFQANFQHLWHLLFPFRWEHSTVIPYFCCIAHCMVQLFHTMTMQLWDCSDPCGSADSRVVLHTCTAASKVMIKLMSSLENTQQLVGDCNTLLQMTHIHTHETAHLSFRPNIFTPRDSFMCDSSCVVGPQQQ